MNELYFYVIFKCVNGWFVGIRKKNNNKDSNDDNNSDDEGQDNYLFVLVNI